MGLHPQHAAQARQLAGQELLVGGAVGDRDAQEVARPRPIAAESMTAR
ncbi:hypothetical protein ACH4YO_13095 [Streptomyces noursei]